MALLLLPLVQKTADVKAPAKPSTFKPHITIVGSEAHYSAIFAEHTDPHPIHALNDKSRFVPSDRYNVSKLLDIYLAREIAKRAGLNVVVNVVNPGLCDSELARRGGLGLRS